MPLWCSYVTWRVSVWERKSDSEWLHTLIKCIHLVVADNNTMRVCFVNNLNQTLREWLYLCTQMRKRTVCGFFTRLWGHWWPLITVLLRVNHWWFVRWMKIWLRSWRSSVSGRRPTTQPSLVSSICHAGTERVNGPVILGTEELMVLVELFQAAFCPSLNRCCENTQKIWPT